MSDSDEQDVPVADNETRPDALIEIASSARDALGFDFAGMTLLRADGDFQSRGMTDQVVLSADRLQYKYGEGPCVAAALEARTIVSSDVAEDPRWPLWGAAAGRLGLRSVLSAELRARGRRIGALNLYSTQPRVFSNDEVALAHLYARQAAVMLASSEEP